MKTGRLRTHQQKGFEEPLSLSATLVHRSPKMPQNLVPVKVPCEIPKGFHLDRDKNLRQREAATDGSDGKGRLSQPLFAELDKHNYQTFRLSCREIQYKHRHVGAQ